MRAIDVRHLGNEHVICCWQVDDVLVDPGPASTLDTLLAALDGERPRAIALTHIHLDHAGATGSLVRRWPGLPVYVHERGAPHLVDPSKLWASASRIYDDMERLWGEAVPVPEHNLRVLRGGETVEGLRVAYAPGHASHHVLYLHEDSGRAFCGDVTGVRIPPWGYTLAPTPPPDIDVEAWHASLDQVAEWSPESLAITHFGAVDDVAGQIAAVREVLDRWAAVARATDQEGFVARMHEEVAARTDPDVAAVYEQAAPAYQLYLGLERYWRKREQS